MMKKYANCVVFIAVPLLILISVLSNRTVLDVLEKTKINVSRNGLNNSSGHNPEKDWFCRSRTDPFWQQEFGDDNNTDWPWNFTRKLTCPNYYYNQYSLHRRKVHLDCSSGSARLVTTLTNSPSDVQVVKPGNKCLHAYIRSCCYDKGMVVPNVMNYVWYADVEVGFFTFVSFISVIRFMKPCIILFHGQHIPKGPLWNFFVSVYPNVILVNQTTITEVFGQKLKYKEHAGDIMRILALKEYGGLYLDWDEVLIKSIDPLRNCSYTMSLEFPGNLGNQFILSEQNATFLTHYLNGYKNYSGAWAHNSIKYPYLLSKQVPSFINVLPHTGLKPKERGGYPLWRGNSDWSENFALHFYLRGFGPRNIRRINMATIRKENTTIGAVCRRILLGMKELCENA